MSWTYKNCKHVLDVPSPGRPCPMSRPMTTLAKVHFNVPFTGTSKLNAIFHYETFHTER